MDSKIETVYIMIHRVYCYFENGTSKTNILIYLFKKYIPEDM